MEQKSFNFEVEFKENSEETGSFVAIFSRFNEVDKHKDITLPGAFTNGEKVKIAAWGHNWGTLPVGKGIIRSDNQKAWVEGKFFIDTSHGLDTYRTIKQLADTQEWSYGFEVLDSEEKGGNRILKKLKVFEVSPVLVGAGNNTGLESIKGYRITDPYDFLLEIQTLKTQTSADELLEQISSLR